MHQSRKIPSTTFFLLVPPISWSILGIDRYATGKPMKLREHPLLSYRGVPSWPPVWMWIDGQDNQKPKGEIGTLKEVRLSIIEPPNRCFLLVDHNDSVYMGCLLINDLAFCAQIAQLLQGYYGHAVREIGSLDLGHTL
jgi:hypothetical protein